MSNSLFDGHSWTFWPWKKETAIPGPAQDTLYSRYVLFLFAFAALVNLLFINNELWQDELYTLDNFVLVPVSQTINDYHSTNNHIVFSLICNLYCRTIGIDQLSELLNAPYLIRIIPYLFTLISIPVLYKGAKKIQGGLMAVITLVIYVSSLQVFTFGTQVRGYSLDLLLCIILINQLLAYQAKPDKIKFLVIVLAGFLLLINLPSSIYFFISVLLLVFLSTLFPLQKISLRTYFSLPVMKIVIALVISFSLFCVFFLFKKEQLEQNSLFYYSGNNPWKLLLQPVSVFLKFLDWRYLLLLPPVILIVFRLPKYAEYRLSLFFVGILLIPFVLFALHNPVIIPRIWIILLPVFCWFLAELCQPLIAWNARNLLLFTIILLLTVCGSLWYLQKEMALSHGNGIRWLELRKQYHLFGYHPRKIVNKIREIASMGTVEFVFFDNTQSGLQYYLDHGGVKTADSISGKSQYVFLICDKNDCINTLPIPQPVIIDSGKDNQVELYKWYLLQMRNQPM